jgi:hypothetical protein
METNSLMCKQESQTNTSILLNHFTSQIYILHNFFFSSTSSFDLINLIYMIVKFLLSSSLINILLLILLIPFYKHIYEHSWYMSDTKYVFDQRNTHTLTRVWHRGRFFIEFHSYSKPNEHSVIATGCSCPAGEYSSWKISPCWHDSPLEMTYDERSGRLRAAQPHTSGRNLHR